MRKLADSNALIDGTLVNLAEMIVSHKWPAVIPLRVIAI
jgi:hypothetical protein